KAQLSACCYKGEIGRRSRAADEEACGRQHLEGGSEYGVAHPIMRPRDFCTQRQKGARAERNGAVEASAEFTASVGRGAARKGKAQASAGHVCLNERGYLEGLRLHGRIGGDGENRPAKMITGLGSSAIAGRIEVRRKFEPEPRTARSHPVLRIAERGGEISGAEIGDAVPACLDHVAVPAPEPLRDAPVGAAAAERKTHYSVGRIADNRDPQHLHRCWRKGHGSRSHWGHR